MVRNQVLAKKLRIFFFHPKRQKMDPRGHKSMLIKKKRLKMGPNVKELISVETLKVQHFYSKWQKIHPHPKDYNAVQVKRKKAFSYNFTI